MIGKTFSHLAEAVQFLAATVEGRNWNTLADMSQDILPAEWVLERLREQNEITPLARLYAGRDFPQEAEAFKLGGHAKELGHIHIDFLRAEGGWKIQRIWMCR